MRESTWRVVCGATALAVIAGCGGPTPPTDGGTSAADAGDPDAGDVSVIDAACPAVDAALPPARGCDVLDTLDGDGCLMPWPSSQFQDPSTHVIVLPAAGMPANNGGVRIDPAPWNGRHGYSPATSMIARIDPANGITDADLASWHVLETGTGGRTLLLDATDPAHVVPVAHFAEVQLATTNVNPLSDASELDPTDASFTTVYVRGASRLAPAHHYVVALRARPGQAPVSSPGFDAMREGSTDPSYASRSEYFGREVFAYLDPLVPRAELIVAWDFWTGTDEDANHDLSVMRDAAFAQRSSLGCHDVVVTPSSNPDGDSFLRVEGSIDVPYFLEGTPTATIDGLPSTATDHLTCSLEPHGTIRAPFVAVIPTSALGQTGPIEIVEYGHGLLNWPNEVAGDEITPVLAMSGVIGVSTVAHGLARSPTATVIGNDERRIMSAFRDLSGFSSVTDHILQGVVAQLVLPHVFANACVPQISDLSGRAVESTHFAWLGNSQGGIMGPTIGALDPSFDRLALGVGGGAYSIMLPRSCDWPLQGLAYVLASNYRSRFARDLIMVMFQTHFDRFEGATFAGRVGDRHVLYQTAVGDLGTPEVSGEIAARTMGLGRLAESATTPLGIDPVSTTDPITRAFVSYSFEGAPTPPIGPAWDIDLCRDSITQCTMNVPNNVHEWVRRDPASRMQLQHFLTTGEVQSFCDAGSCANRPACPPN